MTIFITITVIRGDIETFFDGKAIQPILVEHLLCAGALDGGDIAINKKSLACGNYILMLETDK